MGASSLMTLIALLVGGGGSDLLDYVSPDAFWRDKQVQVSVESMARELKPVEAVDVSKLLDDLNSPDAQARSAAADKLASAGPAAVPALREAERSSPPQVAAGARGIIARIEAADRPARVRRLMAIRTLGELKKPEAVATLEPLLKSDEPFVAEYAREAVAQINGKPTAHSHPNLRNDVWLLPKECRAAGQLASLPSTRPASEMMLSAPLLPGQDRKTMEQGLNQMLISAADNLGNVRLDGVTFGVSGDVGENSGFVVMLFRGTYDAHAVGDWMHRAKVPSHVVGKSTVYQIAGGETTVFFPSDQYAVMVAGPKGKDLPVERVADAIRARRGELHDVAEMRKLIEAVPDGQPVWATLKITPAFAQAPVLAPFDTVTLGSESAGGAIKMNVRATGSKPDQAKNAAQMINAGARQAAEQMKSGEQFMPFFKPLREMMESVKCDADGGNATLALRMDGNWSVLSMAPLMGVQAQATTAPAAPAPAPAGK